MKRIIFLTLALLMIVSVAVVATVSSSAAIVNEENIAETGLATPEITEISVVNDGIETKWGKVDGVAKYRVFYRTNLVDDWTKAGDTTSLSFVFKNVTVLRRYYFTVRGMNSSGKYVTDYDPHGRDVVFQNPVVLKYAQPTYMTYQNEHGVMVAWTRKPTISYYRVYMKKNSGSWKRIADCEDYYTYFVPDSQLESGNNYSFTVRGITFEGELRTGYDTAGKSLYYVSCPPKLKIENTVEGQKLTYTRQTGAAKYRIFVKNGAGWKKLVDTNNSFVNKNVADGENYIYTIRSLDKNGNYLSWYNPNGYAKTFVKAPGLTDIKNASTGYILPCKGYYKYRIFIKNGSSWKGIIDDYAGNWIGLVDWRNQYAFKNKTAYTFTIRAMDDEGHYVSGYNKTGWTSTYFTTEDVYMTKIANTTNGVKLSWSSRAAAKKYRVFVDSGSGWKKLGDTTALSYIDKTAKKGTLYTYTVRGLDSSGNYSTYFDTDGLSIIYDTPAAIKLDSAKVTNNLNTYASDLGFRLNSTLYWEHARASRYLPDTSRYLNAGDLTTVYTRLGRKWLRNRYDYMTNNYFSVSDHFYDTQGWFDDGLALFIW